MARIIYFVTTLAFTGFYMFSVYGYATQPQFWMGEYQRLGYPGYLVTIMMVVKTLGVLAVWVRWPPALAQLAYAGFFFHLALAANAHFQIGEANVLALPLGLLACVVLSWATQNSARTPPAAYAP